MEPRSASPARLSAVVRKIRQPWPGRDITSELIGSRLVCDMWLDGGLRGSRITELRTAAFFATNAALVRAETSALSFSASAAYRLQHERVRIGAEFSYDERNPVDHETERFEPILGGGWRSPRAVRESVFKNVFDFER